MESTKFGQIFFESTRGKIVSRLRWGVGTVEELAGELGLTDNAVRAHLTTLERDGLVERSGAVRGPRKPHVGYQLTDEASQLFPKAYHVLLNHLLAVLKARLDPAQLQEILRETARSLAQGQSPNDIDETLNSRAARAAAFMGDLGGAVTVETTDSGISIKSGRGCPFAEAAADHPEICFLAETLLSEITGLDIHEHCRRGPAPQCSFKTDMTDSPNLP